MKHLKYIFSLIFIAGMLQAKAQTRNGVQLTMPVGGKLIQLMYEADKLSMFPQIGFYHQRWVTDRIFKYKTLSFQHYALKNLNFDESGYKNSINLIDYNWGRGMYWNHHEFEDDYAWYTSLGFGVAIGWESVSHFAADKSIIEKQSVLSGNFTIFRIGISLLKLW